MLWNIILISFGHEWHYHGLSLKFGSPPEELMEFPEGNANYCFWSVHSTPAGIDMPYQHASAALSETPLGALIFARALFGSCWLSWMHDSDEQQDFFLLPQAGAWALHSCLLGWVLGGSSTQGEEVFHLKNRLRHRGNEGGPRGGQEPQCGAETAWEAAALPYFPM